MDDQSTKRARVDGPVGVVLDRSDVLAFADNDSAERWIAETTRAAAAAGNAAFASRCAVAPLDLRVASARESLTFESTRAAGRWLAARAYCEACALSDADPERWSDADVAAAVERAEAGARVDGTVDDYVAGWTLARVARGVQERAAAPSDIEGLVTVPDPRGGAFASRNGAPVDDALERWLAVRPTVWVSSLGRVARRDPGGVALLPLYASNRTAAAFAAPMAKRAYHVGRYGTVRSRMRVFFDGRSLLRNVDHDGWNNALRRTSRQTRPPTPLTPRTPQTQTQTRRDCNYGCAR